MKKIFSTIIFTSLVTLNFIPESTEAAGLPCQKWKPPSDLAKIPFYFDCEETQGDIAVAKVDGIYWCQDVADKIEKYYPNSSHFFFVHEYGHYVKGSDEPATDCWAAQQLANTCYISGAVSYFMAYGNRYKEGYGYMRDRANNVQRCANNR